MKAKGSAFLTHDSRIGLVLLNLGAPETTKEIGPFLRRLLSDPAVVPLPWPLRHFLAFGVSFFRHQKVERHYKELGGKSPLGMQTRMQVEALRAHMDSRFVIRYAFRHTRPFIQEVVQGLVGQGIRQVIALPMYPQYSNSTTGSGLSEIRRVARDHKIDIVEIESYPDAPGYIESIYGSIQEILEDSDHILFCAHGLPMRIIRQGDPYIEHTQRTVHALVKRLTTGQSYSLAYQSRVGKGEWTRPYLSDELARLADEKKRSVVVVPLSFVAENLETLYELDKEYARFAKQCGIENYRRISTPGIHPAFIRELAEFASQAARSAGWEVKS